MQPELVRATMGRHFERMRTIAERHGGTVEKFIGDAVMVVFGVPRVHDDDAERRRASSFLHLPLIDESGSCIGSPRVEDERRELCELVKEERAGVREPC